MFLWGMWTIVTQFNRSKCGLIFTQLEWIFTSSQPRKRFPAAICAIIPYTNVKGQKNIQPPSKMKSAITISQKTNIVFFVRCNNKTVQNLYCWQVNIVTYKISIIIAASLTTHLYSINSQNIGYVDKHQVTDQIYETNLQLTITLIKFIQINKPIVI